MSLFDRGHSNRALFQGWPVPPCPKEDVQAELDQAADRAIRESWRRSACEAWAVYYVETELFDRSLPGRWSPRERDCWLPLPEMMGRSAAFSGEQHRKVRRKLDGIPRATSEWARVYVLNLPWQEQLRLAGREPSGPA